jgi:DUF4097 and DUF4098 domain-containing protein YvlB
MKIALLLAFVSSTALAVAKSETYSASETFSQSYPLAVTGSVRLANINGSIEITAWDKNEVFVEAEKRAKNPEDLARIHIEVEAQPDHLAIGTVHDKVGFLFGSDIRGEVRYKVKVPVGAKLEKISGVNSVLTVSDVHGAVTLQTVNGTIRASGLAGDARIETVNGSVTARFSEVSANQSIEVESVNGSCQVFLPKDVSARISLASVNGSTSCDFPITLERSTRRALRGTIGSGAIAVKASTVNGSVKLNRL